MVQRDYALRQEKLFLTLDEPKLKKRLFRIL
jgi:hypothetical protein